MTHHLATLLPAAGDVADAAELTRAASELGPLVALILGASVVLVFLFRGTFGWLTAREERLKAQPAARSSTPPGGTQGVGVIHADLRALEERIRALENKEASSSTAMNGLREEMRRDMDTLKESSAAQAAALQALAKAVDKLSSQVEWYTKQRQP